MNRALGLIIAREYLTRVRRRAFLIGTFLMPILSVLVIGGIGWMGARSEGETKVLVVDRAGLITKWYEAGQAWVPTHPECFPERSDLAYRFTNEVMADSTFLASDFDAMIEFDDAIVQHAKAMLYYERSPGLGIQSKMQGDLSQAIERFRVKQELALDYETYKRLKTSVSLVGQDIVTQDQGAMGRGIIGFVFSLSLFLLISMYGTQVMRGVIEEKANRIVEVVISAVSPRTLMAGKIIGVGLVGLTQFTAFVLIGWGMSALGGLALEASGALGGAAEVSMAPGLDWKSWLASQDELAFLLDVNWTAMALATVAFYVTGYTLYASLFAAVGAAVNQESDAQYLMLPVMLPLLASYIMAAMSMEDPEGTMAVVGSFVPFSAPVMMLVRIPLGVPMWEVLASLAGVALTAWGVVVLAGRVYRVGLLMYGKRPTFGELVRWMFHRS